VDEDRPILIDDRAGSKDYYKYLNDIGVLGYLEYGDVGFIGFGPRGKAIPVGAEIKTLEDVLSCIHSGRFAGHQLPGMRQSYEVSYLLIEGTWRTNRGNGLLEVPRAHGWRSASWGGKAHTGKSFQSWLISMEQIGGIHVRSFRNKRDLSDFIRYLYSWFSKDWDEHSACSVADESGKIFSFTKPGLLRRVAKEFPGIGYKTLSARVEEHFESTHQMVNAEVEEWMEIPGIGRKKAERIYRDVRSGK
jgi:ERCC4-type nuclease